jgi:hypothetical protein
VDNHRDNPRLVFREDVIAAIAANLKGRYWPKHAIHERPVGGRFQRVAGYHRVRAARQAVLEQIWAWVEPLDDETALMELVLARVAEASAEGAGKSGVHHWEQGIPASVLRNHAVFEEALPEMIDLPAHRQERG